MTRSGGRCARRLGVLALTILAVCAFTTGVSAEEPAAPPGIPRAMMYEGYITDTGGQPLPDGPYDFRFSLYETATGGEPVWTEQHLGVEVSGGVVQVRLGEGTTPTALDVPFDVQYYLGIQVGGDPEMSPRLKLMTTAYAFRAGMADEVPDASITSEKLEPLAVTDEHIASVSWEKITDAPTAPGGGRGGGGPVPSSVWHTKGNRGTDPSKDYVGTSDEVALNLATYDSMRFVIASDGKIAIDKELEVGDYITSRKSDTEGGFLLADPGHGLKRVGNDNVRLFTTGGHLLLEGGNVGIGTTTPAADLHIVSTNAGGESDITSYPVLLESKTQGLAIKLDTSRVNKSNNFISFWDNGEMRGRIEGQNTVDLLSSPEYIYFTLIDALELSISTIQFIGDCGDVRVCVGFGVVTCPPGFSTIAASAAALALQAARAIGTQVFLWGDLGVAYQSSSGDYAEWLERLDPSEVLEPGDIVGVFGGKVTKRTEGAQQVMVVSHAPIVLGNMPPEGEEHLYAKVAFMGQVPVKVAGRVKPGDYVIPSGLSDGHGVAVAPMFMTAEEYAKVVGRSWSESAGEPGAMADILVGLNQGDIADAVLMQQVLYEGLREEMAEKGSDVAALEAEVAQLRASVQSFSELYQEVQSLRAAVSGSAELSPVSGTVSDDEPVPGGSW